LLKKPEPHPDQERIILKYNLEHEKTQHLREELESLAQTFNQKFKSDINKEEFTIKDLLIVGILFFILGYFS